MQPNSNQNPTSPTPPIKDPYDFIFNAPQKQFSPLGNITRGGGFRTKLIFIIGAAILIVLILVIGKALLGGSSNNLNLPSMYAIESEQQQLITAVSYANQNDPSSNYGNFSSTTLAVIINDQLQLTRLLTKNGIKLNPKLIILKPQVIEELSASLQTDNFEPTYLQVITNQLQIYQSELSSGYRLNNSPLIRKYLTADYQHVQMLQKMLTLAT